MPSPLSLAYEKSFTRCRRQTNRIGQDQRDRYGHQRTKVVQLSVRLSSRSYTTPAVGILVEFRQRQNAKFETHMRRLEMKTVSNMLLRDMFKI